MKGFDSARNKGAKESMNSYSIFRLAQVIAKNNNLFTSAITTEVGKDGSDEVVNATGINPSLKQLFIKHPTLFLPKFAAELFGSLR